MTQASTAAPAGGRTVKAAVLLVTVFFLTFLGRTILSPLLLEIQADLGVSIAVGGSFFLVISAGLIASMLVSGFVSRRVTHHGAIAISALLVGAGLLVLSASDGLFLFRLGLLVIGSGAGLYLPSGVATLTDVVPRRLWGRALAFHELGPILGLAAAPPLAELSLRFLGWRPLLAGLGILAAAMAGVFARFGAGGRFPGQPPEWRALREIAGRGRFWAVVFFFTMAIGLELGVYAMLPSYLVAERGMAQSLVNGVVGSSRLTSLTMVFAAGWLADHFGVRRVVAAVAVSAGIVTALIGAARGPVLLVAVYLQPMLISAFFPAGLTALAEVSTPERRNLVVSVVMPIAYLVGAGAFPAVIGRLAEAGSFGVGFLAVGVLMVTGAAAAPALGRPSHDATSAGR